MPRRGVGGGKMRVLIEKSRRWLRLMEADRELLRARIALGSAPCGPKRREGDGRTPEGVYQICLAKECGKYGRSLALNYPNAADAHLAYAEHAIDQTTWEAILLASAEGRRPPWGTPLGGEIYLHEGPTDTDWTRGCIALAPTDMAQLFALRNLIEEVEIRP
jgi:murein L,D-transpeptidase YafK